MSMLKKKAKEKRKRRNRFKKFLERGPLRFSKPEEMAQIDYKNVDLLQKLVSQQGRILSRRRNGASPQGQKRIKQAIKQARHMALIPYSG